MIGLVYSLVIAVSTAGIMTIDHRWKLAFFRNARATWLAIAASMSLLLIWDVLGIRSGIFFRGETEFMTGLLVAPELPVEEIGFLFFLSYIALVLAGGARRVAEHSAVSESRR